MDADTEPVPSDSDTEAESSLSSPLVFINFPNLFFFQNFRAYFSELLLFIYLYIFLCSIMNLSVLF